MGACMLCARMLVLAAVPLLVVACGSMWGGSASSGSDAKAAPAKPSVSALEAPVNGIAGSVVNGYVRFNARAGGVNMLAHLTGLPPGSYKIVIHAHGLCNSPNGFSAGPPWAPDGMKPPIADRVVMASVEGRADLTMRIDGLALEGPQSIEGKSVIVHESTARTLEAEPGVRNGRIACGVIGPVNYFSF